MLRRGLLSITKRMTIVSTHHSERSLRSEESRAFNLAKHWSGQEHGYFTADFSEEFVSSVKA